MRLLRFLLAAVSCLIAAPLLAQPDRSIWREAATKHFIVYSKDSEARVRKLATELELFDSVIRSLHAAPDDPALHSNRVTVFVADDVAAVQKLCGCANVYGFYVPRAEGAVAFTPRSAPIEKITSYDRITTGTIDVGLNPRTVLFHEYGHHFLLGNYAAAYPAWFVEGYAEFVSTAAFTDDIVQVGGAATHRAFGLAEGGVPIRRLFDQAAKRPKPEEREAVYGRGWVLTHYLMFDPAMREKFDRYMKALNAGTPSIAAAEAAFGDLGELDQALDKYMKARRLKVFNLKRDSLPVPAVTMRALSPGETALIDLRMQSVRGVNDKTAGPLFVQASALAAPFANDPAAQGWLAEMAFDAKDYAAAEAAADRALARNPKSMQALLYRGRAGLELARAATAKPADWAAARRWIVQANKTDPEAAAPLVAYYNSFLREGRTPTTAAIAGLHRAHELVPQDGYVRLNAAGWRVREGKIEDAKRLLAPLAYNPHRTGENAASRLLAALDKAPDQAAAITALETAQKDSAKDADAED